MMIDLHCHILPGLDDGAADLSVSIRMATLLMADGVSVVACTPHILPGLYQNSGPQILEATQGLQQVLDREGIGIQLIAGADNHIVPDFVAQLRRGNLLPLAGSRYVLIEPPHHVAPPKLEEFFFNVLVAGYVPILTHPERLTWIDSRYSLIRRLARAGVWMQVTAGSLTGVFGRNAQYWAERLLGEGFTHILATDAHDESRRRPNLGEGFTRAAELVGDVEAQHLVGTRPRGILQNINPSRLPSPLFSTERAEIRNAAQEHCGVEEKRPPTSDVASRAMPLRLRRFFK
jgi:protein-tyrosine phosphatase